MCTVLSAYGKSWALDELVWTLGLWTPGRLGSGCMVLTLELWMPGCLDSGGMESGRLDSRRLDAWTLDAWAKDDWTLGFWKPDHLDAWTLEDWTLGLWAIGPHVRISKDNSYSTESISSNAANFRNSLLTLSVTS